MTNEEKIEKWFGVWQGGSMLLPTGWFGRPFDNIHTLSSVAEWDDKLELRLDDDALSLRLYGQPIVLAEDGKLVISGYDRADFHWKEYGGETLHQEQFREGAVTIYSSEADSY